jgi:hypothetical protein
VLKVRIIACVSVEDLEEKLNHFLRVEGIGVELPLVDIQYAQSEDDVAHTFSVMVVYEVPEKKT